LLGSAKVALHAAKHDCLNAFGHYLALRQHGSLSAAAREVGVSQPTMRRRIEALEAGLGQPLFTRSATGLHPLADDQGLLALAEVMGATAAAFQRRAGEAEAVAGVVRLSVPEVFGVAVMPKAIADLRRVHSGLVIELSLTNAVEDLLRRDADIAIRLTQPVQEALVAQKVAATEVGLFAADAAWAGQSYAAICASMPFVADDRRRQIADGFALLGLPPPANIVLRTDSDAAQLAAIQAGVGVGICQVTIGRSLGLVQLCTEVMLSLPTWVVMHEDLRGLARARVVFDHMVQVLNKR
jgi:DNA-binding transcriptional LysR family regulator